jgi:threonine dehydratase
VKVQQTRAFGAEVVQDGDTYDESAAIARKLCDERELTFVHPFDDLKVMAGQGTVALEMFEEQPDIEVLPVPIGGGGLIAGCATVAKSINPNCRVIGVEPAMYPSFTARMQGIEAITGGATIAEGIAVKRVGDLTYAVARPLIDEVLLLDEPFLEQAVALFCNVEKTVAEGAGAAALAALLAYPDRFQGKKVGVILCGGNIDPLVLARVIEHSLAVDGRLVQFSATISDRPGGLAELATTIASTGASVQDIRHERIFGGSDVSRVRVSCVVEVRDARHADELQEALRGKGIPSLNGRGRGDQLVQVVVAVPKELSPRESELIRELAEIHGAKVPEKEGGFLKGIFGRITS